MELPLFFNQQVDLTVVGGGPAGFMAAITAAQSGVASVVLLESNAKTLEKVRISGGGRCNVTHACWDPGELVTNYPRGRLALMSAFSRFAAGDAVNWFEDKGLRLIAEQDGRIFPVSNSSSDVVTCLRNAAKASGVHFLTKQAVNRVDSMQKNRFFISSKGSKPFESKKVLLATGSHSSGRKIAQALGHSIVNPVPSLFSLKLDSFSLSICSGVALDNVKITLFTDDKSFQEIGRVLITHQGLSGPAVLRLTAFAARHLSKLNYKARLSVNWIDSNYDSARSQLNNFRYTSSRSRLVNSNPFSKFPKRFWLEIIKQAKVDPYIRWAELSSVNEKRLLNILISNSYNVFGKGPYGEEFVTAGGVRLDEINMTTMESLVVPGLYFAGELLDIDGITGGFNFQHCWSSGWLAGKAIANSLNPYLSEN